MTNSIELNQNEVHRRVLVTCLRDKLTSGDGIEDPSLGEALGLLASRCTCDGLI